MVGVAVETDIGIAARALDRLTDEQIHMIVDEIGALIVQQTQERFETRTDPDGTAWVPWTEGYAHTRHANQSLLISEGHLSKDIQQFIHGWGSDIALHVGSDWIYGASHQFGSEDGTLPARPYLGLSADNRAEIEDLVVGRLEDLLQ